LEKGGFMALYLVRWSGLRASLIDAYDEADLLMRLDEVEDPSDCTWQLYEGPLWVDFEVPAKFDINPTQRSRLELSDVHVSVPARDWSVPLSFVNGDSGAEPEMLRAVLQDAFPSLAAALDESGDEDPSVEVIEGAVAQDLVGHHNQAIGRSVTFASDAQRDLVLRATRSHYFIWRRTHFEPINREIVDAFLFGERSFVVEEDDKVRLASVEIALNQERPLFVVGVRWRAFGVASNGMIVEPHQADAFAAEDDSEPAPFLRSRNSAVRWSPNKQAIAQLKKALSRHFGRGLRVSKLPSSDVIV